MKKRKFADGGETEELVGPESREAILARLAGMPESEESSREFAAPGRFSSSKPKVVTKEELAKSGLSLRDYMNQQQGLKPRTEATLAPSKAKLDVPNASGPRSAATPMSTDPLQRSKPKYQSLQDRENENAAKRKESGVGMYGTRNSAKDTRTAKRAGNLTDMLGLSSQYASGGSVSSRADGIAQRGKTRGKMC